MVFVFLLCYTKINQSPDFVLRRNITQPLTPEPPPFSSTYPHANTNLSKHNKWTPSRGHHLFRLSRSGRRPSLSAGVPLSVVVGWCCGWPRFTLAQMLLFCCLCSYPLTRTYCSYLWYFDRTIPPRSDPKIVVVSHYTYHLSGAFSHSSPLTGRPRVLRLGVLLN